MPNPLVGPGYSDYIGTRQLPGQTQTEFYNLENNQAYLSPNDLLRAIQPYAGNQMVDESNVFDVLKTGLTPRATALDQIKNELNGFQQQTFEGGETSNKRAASSITDSITSEQGNYSSLTNEYNELRKKLQTLQAPNYQDQYNQLRQSSGIGAVENDFANNQKTIRELPYVNRQNFGNAGVATEGQLQADTQQKGIPLEIQQGNLLDRLKLAQDFVNNSLKFKEMDANASRQSLTDGINAVLQTIDLSRTNIQDLLAQQKTQIDRDQIAQQFAFENRVSKPFYDIGGTVYRTSDRMPAHNQAEYVAMGGKGDFSDVQKISSDQLQERNIVADLAASYPTSGIQLTDSFATAQSKLASLSTATPSSTVRSTVRSSSGGGSRSSSKASTKPSISSFKFTSTQLAKGAAAAGIPLDEFTALDDNAKNEYINGAYNKLVNGRVPGKELEKMKVQIEEAVKAGEGIGELRGEIDSSDLPQADKEDLKAFVEQKAKDEKGFFDKVLETGGNFLKKLNPFD